MEWADMRETSPEKVGIGCCGETGVNRIFGPCKGNSAPTGVLGDSSSGCHRFFRRMKRNATRASKRPIMNRTPITIPIIAPVESAECGLDWEAGAPVVPLLRK
jgi:hypothetical protein